MFCTFVSAVRRPPSRSDSLLAFTSIYRRCICSRSFLSAFSESCVSRNLTKASPLGRPSRPRQMTIPSRSIAQPSKKSLISRSDAENGNPLHFTTNDFAPELLEPESRELFASSLRRGLRVRLRALRESPLLSRRRPLSSASGLSSRLRLLLSVGSSSSRADALSDLSVSGSYSSLIVTAVEKVAPSSSIRIHTCATALQNCSPARASASTGTSSCSAISCSDAEPPPPPNCARRGYVRENSERRFTNLE
mmetsp:Transcript_1271/g.1709  ORF Transcript_1271/g.1709 Transcript_1271/m.1709 type:complete len:250 (-) Transcript_1271:338-1087(-)